MTSPYPEDEPNPDFLAPVDEPDPNIDLGPSDQTPPVVPWDTPPPPGSSHENFNPQPAPPGTSIIYGAEGGPDAVEEA